MRYCYFSLIPRPENGSEVMILTKHPTPSSAQSPFSELEAFFHGHSTHAWQFFGSHAETDSAGVDGFRFRVWAPNAPAVSVIGLFNHWNPNANPMTRSYDGIWEAFIPDLPAHTVYQFAIVHPDGTFTGKCDPFAFYTNVPPHISSRICPPEHSSYVWGDRDWLRYRSRSHASIHSQPMNIYECHLGSWRRTGEGAFLPYRDIALYLVPYLKEMGYTHVEFLPVTEHPMDSSWGYQCTGYFAPTSRFGTPDDFKYLIDQLHQAGVGVILDWVPAHFPRDAFGLALFDGTPTYESSNLQDRQTPWGTNRFDFSCGPVRSFLLSSALFWLDEYHADGLRIGALDAMLHPSSGQEDPHARSFLQSLISYVSAAHPDVLMMAEGLPSDPSVTAPVADGGLGFHFRWDTAWTDDLLRYIQMVPAARRQEPQLLSAPLLRACSAPHILPLSHDNATEETGSFFQKFSGDDALRFAAVRAFYTYAMACPGKKLTFMGTEFVQREHWKSYYSLDWHLLGQVPHLKALTFFRELNALYLEQPALWERDDDPAAIQWLSFGNTPAFLRYDCTGHPILAVCNFTLSAHRTRLGVPFGGLWSPVFFTDDSAFSEQPANRPAAQRAQDIPCHDLEHSLLLNLPPLSAVLYVSSRTVPPLTHLD